MLAAAALMIAFCLIVSWVNTCRRTDNPASKVDVTRNKQRDVHQFSSSTMENLVITM